MDGFNDGFDEGLIVGRRGSDDDGWEEVGNWDGKVEGW